MSTEKIQYYCFKMLNGLKYLSENQFKDFKSIVLSDLNLEDNDKNNLIIKNAAKKYFSQ